MNRWQQHTTYGSEVIYIYFLSVFLINSSYLIFFSVLAVEWKLHLNTYTGCKLFGPDPLNGCVTSAAVKWQQTQDWASI